MQDYSDPFMTQNIQLWAGHDNSTIFPTACKGSRDAVREVQPVLSCTASLVCQFTPHSKRFRKVRDNTCIGELVCIQTNSSLHHELIIYLQARCSLHNESTLVPSSTVFRAATSAYFRRATPTETHVTVAPSIGEPSQHTAKTLGYPSNHIIIHT